MISFIRQLKYANDQHDLACVALGISFDLEATGETLLEAVRALIKDRNEWKEEADLREKGSDVWAHECDVLREQLKEDEKALENNIEIFVDLKETINKAEDQLASERAISDQLAAIVQRNRDGHGGMLTDPECFCEDCEHLRVLEFPAVIDWWVKCDFNAHGFGFFVFWIVFSFFCSSA